MLHPYDRYRQDELTLRDELAIDRTLLANERTLLAYQRTAMALVIAGVTFLHFVTQGLLIYFGIGCIILGIVLGVVGAYRFIGMQRSIARVRQMLNQAESARPDTR